MPEIKTLTEMDMDKDEHEFLVRCYTEDKKAHEDAIVNFDAYEAMANSQTYDAVSRETKSELTDSMTATIYLERAARVAGQLPTGQVNALGKQDMGKAMLMDILLQKWIYPNANAQRPLKQKMFMWQFGSSEYGVMPMYYDLNVTPSGYFGPDAWLWNPRKFIPQNGFTSIADMDYVHALADKSPSWFEDLLEEDDDSGWNKQAIEKIIDVIKNATKNKDEKMDTKKAREQSSEPIRQVTVATRYEAGEDGRWISFLPDYGNLVIRDIENPHENGRIPFVIKPCIPTFDSYYGVGDFQRSMPMQFANDGLDNFYFQGIKINLFPPIIVNSQGVVRHTVKPGQPASVWEETEPNSIRRLDTSTAGLSTYQSAKGMAKGAVQSIAGTTDTRTNAEDASDPAFGKTPEALKKISERESTRDNQDREMLEEAMQELIDGWLSIIPTIAEKIPVDLFQKEIEEIAKTYPDLTDLFTHAKQTEMLDWRVSESKKQMRLKIDPSKLGGMTYRFQLEPNSTAKETKEAQLGSIQTFFDFVGKVPNALQQYQESTGKVPNWEWFFNKFGELAGINGFENAFSAAATPPQAPVTPGAPTAQPSGQPASPEDLAAAEAALGGGGTPAPAPTDQLPQPPVATPQAPAPAAPQPIQPPAETRQPVAVIGGVPFYDPVLAQEAQNLLNSYAS